MAFSYLRTIHFPDTDAAGVVFFANYLAICHEAYEDALGAAGLELKTFFADTGTVVPITRSEAEYLRPLACGDKVRVTVRPESLTEDTYAVRFEVTKLGPVEKLAARVRTEHFCIATQSRERRSLPPQLAAWVRGGG
jgi:1,4-dihydroxy-2-naphthoyl-CoA hydrolase